MQQSICNCPKEDGTWDANIHGLGKIKLTHRLGIDIGTGG